MKIKAVRLMRDIRDRISADTENMTWAEEQEYLKNHITVFSYITKKTSNKSLQPTPTSLPLRRDG
jgi:hypothetical protein